MKRLLPIIFAIGILMAFAACSTPPPVAPPPPPPVVAPPPPPPVEEVAEELPPPPPPELQVTLSPQPFSPDSDGENDLLTVSIRVRSEAPIYGWRIQIREPAPLYNLFSEWEGEGMPPQTLIWDGHSTSGELVQSATDYHFALIVTNINNDSTTYQGTISVDVLVQREEGGVLRVIVPSIVFAADSGDLYGLSPEVAMANRSILVRVAEVLNRYGTYHVKIEGHANPVSPPGSRARATEETGSRTVKGLQALSEERAKAVVDYLVNLGVDASRLSYVGMGGTRPVVEYADRDNWWKNRRVEFILIR